MTVPPAAQAPRHPPPISSPSWSSATRPPPSPRAHVILPPIELTHAGPTTTPHASDATAYLTAHVFPALVPALEQLAHHVDLSRSQGHTRAATAIDPVVWLAQYLYRHNPIHSPAADAARGRRATAPAVLTLGRRDASEVYGTDTGSGRLE
ncbi:hypothetical protein AMAG_20176 [Allomyces macrogynus ATCC 38327]|uniref:Uncharacterized protein n=1 Tax=Allomyces macrogynus (strain ATCC 38327) TaxID=578462 RepID=A0A0L0T895_ALLM3|nr:hypothetical protein AMAG_20176 [Allomyces macrogynus ATCC 38327]|eukprot:KNE70789.1 hypothetical protein AMAG_20176 [Allomyces macrogynus ATCC 38327]